VTSVAKRQCLSAVIARQKARSAVFAHNDPAIHEDDRQAMTFVSFSAGRFIMDARVEPAHDAEILAKAV
jgi:hypothetical protein